MARIKIDFPQAPLFKTQIPVRITDLNYGGHVGNDSILSLIHEARIQFLASLGYSELNFAGVGLIMADVGISFINESFYGDLFEVSISIGDITKVSFDIYYLFTTQKDGEEKIIAKAKTGMVCFNYEERKVTFIPEEIIKKLN